MQERLLPENMISLPLICLHSSCHWHELEESHFFSNNEHNLSQTAHVNSQSRCVWGAWQLAVQMDSLKSDCESALPDFLHKTLLCKNPLIPVYRSRPPRSCTINLNGQVDRFTVGVTYSWQTKSYPCRLKGFITRKCCSKGKAGAWIQSIRNDREIRIKWFTGAYLYVPYEEPSFCCILDLSQTTNNSNKSQNCYWCSMFLMHFRTT